MLCVHSLILCMCHVFFNRRQMEISQKAAEEEERYKKEMEKYTTSFGFLKRSTVSDLVLRSDEVAGYKQ